MSKNVRRLYDQFKPEAYELTLSSDPEALTFSGSVSIQGIKVGRPSARLTFHQKDLKISQAKIIRHTKDSDEVMPLKRINLQKSFDEVRLHSAGLLYPGKYTVTLEFSGTITRPMSGIYPCFFEYQGKQQKLIATQFESHHAREAFPCIDEPEAKATFDLTLLTPTAVAVVGNTSIKKQTTAKKQLTTIFDSTPKMSTYLLAFVYGQMEYLEATTKHGVVVRTYATPDNTQHTRFALDIAVACLDFYNDYFGTAYPLPKCDFLALPDFAAGAMENWGCITFREQTLLVDPKNTSLPIKQYVALVVAHELAHQWFGNLVTMRWWTDLWLNEGFASWIEYLAVDHLFPEWHMWTEFLVNEQEAGMRLDALENTHPIEVPIHHPDEIRTIFDTISYSKGSSVLYMLHAYLGADDFRDGLRHYLQAHAYGNTDTVDLWNALETVSGKPVRDFMQAWTTQPGFPVVHAEIATDNPSISQERFYVNPAVKKADTLWPVPLLASESLGIEIVSKAEVAIHPQKLSSQFVINQGHSGFYRTTYDSVHLASLTKAVGEGELPLIERLELLSDAFETAKAGYSSSVDALQLLNVYNGEDNMFVWDVIAGGLGTIRAVMDDEALRDNMKPFVRKLVSAELSRLGWEQVDGESHFDTLLRPTILGLASVSEEPAVVAEALRQFKAMKRPEDIAPDLRGVVYGTVARNGGAAEFDRLLTMHNASTNGEERVTLSVALSGFKQPAQITRALEQIDSDNVRLQDAAYWVIYGFMNRFARDMAWEWMTTHWEWLEKNLGDDMAFSRFPMYAARAYSDSKFLATYKSFFEPRLGPTLERSIKQGIETIEWQAAWRSRDLAGIKQFFAASPK
jgi:puromycin-sensitive aminopeptidase